MSENNEKKVHGTVAEYESVDTLLHACRRVRDAGYIKTDAYTPFPVHGIDKALGIKPTVLPWIVLVCGLTGTVVALVMQIWMNAIDYRYIISGKPYISLPAFMPVVFELTVLFSSFGAFFGMWALNGLPRFSNPMFTDPRFDRVTDDRFFLYVDASDDKYDESAVREIYNQTGGEHIKNVFEDDSSDKIPKPIFMAWGLVIAASVIPLLIVLKMRVTNSESPRFHIFYDMDFSPAKDAQQGSTLFADGRAMRPDVVGTVARGESNYDMDFMTGVQMDKLAAVDAPRAERLVRLSMGPIGPQEDSGDTQDAEKESGEEEKSETAPNATDTTPWLTVNPLGNDEDTLRRGQKYFGIYCSVCHGMNGGGNGLVNRRARKILSEYWIPPSSLHQETLYGDQYPDGKLFSTISNGIRKMPGYAGQIKAKDRWAIVAYVRALQKSRNASIDLIPESMRPEILEELEAVEQRLTEEAEAEQAAE
ncbi:MAG: quinol:electron acceptor oxidoreductase subunit ActD, partial [Rubripirellula sp.]